MTNQKACCVFLLIMAHICHLLSFLITPSPGCSRSLLSSWYHPDLGWRPAYYAPCPPPPSIDWPVPSNAPSIHPPPIQATHGYQGKLSKPCWAHLSPAMGLRSSSALAKLGPTECQLQWVFCARDLLPGKWCLNSSMWTNTFSFPIVFPKFAWPSRRA